MAMLRVHLFGGLMVSWDESPLPPIAGAVARSLFAYLLTYRHRSHTRDLLTGTFWPDLPDGVARRRLSQALWQIRKALDPHPVLLTEGDTVQINPGLPLWLDVEEFARHKFHCTGEGPAEESKALVQCELCLELYRGDFLAGYYDDWLFPERERLRDQLLDVLERLVAGYKRQGDDTAALAHARRLAAEDPLREGAHHEVMRLCHLLGRDVEALQQFEICRQVLAEELGVKPSPETAALAQEIAERGGQAAQLVLPQVSPFPAAFLLDSSQGSELPLVGRDAERAELLAHVEALFQGLGGAVLLEGEAGVGKTRLLRAIAADAEWRGAEVLWGSGRQVEASVPYGPLVEALSGGLSPLRARQLAQVVEEIWLRVMARLLPSLVLDLRPLPSLEPVQERDRLVNALAQLLAGWAQIAPLLLIIEDLHWAREDSLDLLARLVPLLSDSGVLILGSYRGEEARTLPEIWRKLQALDRVGVRQRLVLGRLNATAAGELVRRSLGLGSPAPLFEARLFEETEGNPLFLLETLRALHGEGLLFRDENGQWSTPWDGRTSDYAELPLPPAVEQIIARRLKVLTPSLRRTIQLAAVLGEQFDFDLLHTASNEQPSELLASLRELVQRRLVDETEQDYRFHHDKIRRVTYDTIEMADRPQLHRRVARALESLRPERVAALAYHWTEAQVWDKSVIYHRQAGDRAHEVYANGEAIEHYARALAALDRLPRAADPSSRYEILLAREAVHDLQGQREAQAENLTALEKLVQAWPGSAQSAEQAAEKAQFPHLLARRRVQVALRRAQYTMAMVDYATAAAMVQEVVRLAESAQITELEAEGYYHWGRALWLLGQWEQARKKLDELLHMARRRHLPDLEAKALGLLTHLAVDQGKYGEARLRGEQALSLFQKGNDLRGESATHHSLGLAAAWEGGYVAAQSHFEQSLSLARQAGYLSGEGSALMALGMVAAEQGAPVQARSHYERALRIFSQLGDRDREGRTLNNLGFILDQLGAHAQAESHFERFLANSRDIGSRHGQVVALVNLAHVSHRQGKDQRALEQGQQAVAHAEEIGERRALGYAWTIVGDALTSLGRLADAESAYRQALALRQELGQPNLAAESLAGLVRVALARHDLSQACAYADEILEHLQTGSLGGTKDPLLVYLSCYQALHGAHDPHAERVLADAYHQLQAQAARITDDHLRRGYLDNIDAHREIITAYAAGQALSYRVVRLPRADAPMGRPLRDDEHVSITWTVAAPEDEAIEAGPARRQARLHRLLQQATDQGATPTVADLAAALVVSEPTIRRDLAALRRAGHPAQTRGSRGG
jgi:DNA-binding SARP family transcriptional activator/Flp pilus assembly protein TadD